MTAFLDTGLIYSLLDRSDEHHQDGVSVVYHALRGNWGQVYTSNYVELEATLLLGSHIGHGAARSVPSFLSKSGFRELIVDGETRAKALGLFGGDDRLSLTDATSLIMMEAVGARTMLSFDERSFAGRGIKVVGRRYRDSLTAEEKEETGAFERSGKRGGG